MSTTLLLVYVVALIVLASVRAVPVASPVVQRLRALFPSWRFFDDIGDAPLLMVRVATSDDEAAIDTAPWEPCLPTPRRRVTDVLWNPQGNLRLAYDSLLMHLLTDIDEHVGPIGSAVSFQLTEQLVAYQLRTHARTDRIVRYQFKLMTLAAGASPEQAQDVLISGVIER